MITERKEIGILFDWESLIFWLYKICPNVNADSGVTLINRLKNTLMDDRDDVQIDDIPEDENDLNKILREYMAVVNRHREFISYWKITGRKDDRLKKYNFKIRIVDSGELKQLQADEIKIPVIGGKTMWGTEWKDTACG